MNRGVVVVKIHDKNWTRLILGRRPQRSHGPAERPSKRFDRHNRRWSCRPDGVPEFGRRREVIDFKGGVARPLPERAVIAGE
jgi:hypothetical protein